MGDKEVDSRLLAAFLILSYYQTSLHFPNHTWLNKAFFFSMLLFGVLHMPIHARKWLT